jgi:hypothetical protein
VTVAIEGNDLDLIEDMFSRLNEAVPLNAAEKRNAIGGNVVKSINRIANHPFFVEAVRFSNSRYQHKEVAARFLLIEDSLATHNRIIDTKKAYLDALAKRYRTDNPQHIEQMQLRVLDVCDAMYQVFSERDELLASQGTMVVYYLIFRLAIEREQLQKITRRTLIDFRSAVSANRVAAEEDFAESSFQLLEYDRLNQQGTNDASSIKERVDILAEWLTLVQASNAIENAP